MRRAIPAAPLRRSQNRSFLSFADYVPAAIPTVPHAESLVSFSC
jgi:hypothetical protein